MEESNFPFSMLLHSAFYLLAGKENSKGEIMTYMAIKWFFQCSLLNLVNKNAN